MILFEIDNYRIEKRNIKSNSNYNVAIDVYKDNELFMGWHEKSNVSDLKILSGFMNGLEKANKRNESNTIEEWLGI